MNEFMIILYLFIAAIGGFVFAFWMRGKFLSDKLKSIDKNASDIIKEANIKANTFLKEAEIEAKERLFKMKSEFDEETKDRKNELKKQEERLIQKEEKFDNKQEMLEEKNASLSMRESKLKKRETHIEQNEEYSAQIIAEQKSLLEKISDMSAEQAKELLLKTMEDEARYESVKLIKKIETEAKETADKKAKEIIATAIQRYAGDYVSQKTVSVVPLPNDEMKGRIIGREGRNIRAIEAATGIDLIIDDTPEAVVLSGFDPVRREVARLSLESLIADGRIHPARIEDIVKKTEKEVDAAIKEAGEQATFDVGIHGMHKDLVRHIGRLKFRTSYAQNVLQHSVEVSFLCGIIASELGLNIKLAKRMGLLHDIGKGIDHEVEGTHALIGSRLAKKCGERQNIVYAIAAHHEELPPTSVYDLIVQAADSLSGARPGARKEILENYIKRIEDLEYIANSFKGVLNSYAIQAGRELRVIVESKTISDDDSFLLSKDIVKKIEETITFPGQIKVTVIRETRAVEYANK